MYITRILQLTQNVELREPLGSSDVGQTNIFVHPPHNTLRQLGEYTNKSL